MLQKYKLYLLDPTVTFLCEIIYPENRIIVDYGNKEELVLLGALTKLEGVESDSSLKMASVSSGMRMARKYEFNSIDEIIEKQSQLGTMEEGFVVRFEDGERVKFKSAEYLKVARLLSELTPLNFWKAMKDGIVQQEIIQEIPEEFRPEVDRIKGGLEASYILTEQEIREDYKYAIESIGGLFDLSEDRKKLGLFIKEHGSELKHPTAMFPMLLENSVDKYIMREIRPKGNEM